MRLALRLSLAARALVALAALGPVVVALCLLGAVFGAALSLGVAGHALQVVEGLADAPRLAAVTPLPAPVAALLALAVPVAVVAGWRRIAPYTADSTLIPPTGPVQWLAVGVVLAALYEFAAEVGATVAAVVDAFGLLFASLCLGAGLGLLGTVWLLRAECRDLRALSVRGADPADPTAHATLVGTTDRLAAVAGVPPPEVRVLDDDRPLAHVVGRRRSATLVVSTGLLAALREDELAAVLAHELAHLANGDTRLTSLALAPVVLAESTFVEDESPADPGELLWHLVGLAIMWVGQFGAAAFTVGRERAADETAARLTGDPAALAAALRTLDGVGPPETDLRASVAALGVLPALAPDGGRAWPFDTHPPTDERVARLRDLAGEYERR